MERTAQTCPYGTSVVVTGASSGIGLACAQAFTEAGFTVWSVARHLPLAAEGARRSLPMDVTDEASVQAAAAVMLRSDAPPRIVIHCAGFGIGGSAEEVPAQLALKQLDVNYLGVLRVNTALLPHLRAQGGGLVLMIGSVAGRVGIPFQGHYSASKFALEAYAETLRMESAPFGVRVCLLEPGDTRTGFTDARQSFVPKDSPYAAAARAAIKQMEKDERGGRPPQSAARLALAMAWRRRPPLRRAVGGEYAALLFAKRLLPDAWAEAILKKMYEKA
ncbi:MAG: SDR family oxidoreductase [Eubacteriales bacterium]|nr:SDR family oxidoreductase [Eubacteriales bacterium]